MRDRDDRNQSERCSECDAHCGPRRMYCDRCRRAIDREEARMEAEMEKAMEKTYGGKP